MSSKKKEVSASNAAISLSQTALALALSEIQVRRYSTDMQQARVMPQQVAVGLVIHQVT